MTDYQSALSAFMADTDVESLRALGLKLHGIDITGVFCLHTGRKVGTFDDFVIQFAVDEESADDDEALVDALLTRCVASMRPSPMLNKPDRITLLNMAERFPVDILAFLVNRLHGNRWLATHRNSDVLDPYIARIEMHQRLTELALKGVDTRPWIHWLLELDTKRNLHDMTPIAVAKSQTGAWIEVSVGESLFRQLDETNHELLLPIFEAWAIAAIREADEKYRLALAQERWMRGNALTQTAYARSWMENPDIASRKEVMKRPLRGTGGVERPKSEKARKLDEKVSQFLHLLDGIMDGASQPVTPPKPARVMLTGATLFRKKES